MHSFKEEQTKIDAVFKKLRVIAKRETDRLGKVTATVLLNYRFRDNGHRYKEIEGIKEKPLNPQLEVPGDTVEARVELLLSMAVWKEKDFQERLMSDIVDPMNLASSITDLCKSYRIDACDYTHDKFGEAIKLVDERYKFSDENDNDEVGKVTEGPRRKSRVNVKPLKNGFETSSNLTSPGATSGAVTPNSDFNRKFGRQESATSLGSESPRSTIYGNTFYNEHAFDGINPEEIEEQVLVKARFGPPKSYQRALIKEKQGLANVESGKHKDWNGLRDLNRVTLEFEDPLMLILAFKGIMKKYKVSGLKNKFKSIKEISYDQPPDIHMNLDFGEAGSPWLVEVQLMFSSILTIKKELHKFYDIVRAESPRDIMSPLFKDFKTNEDRQIDEKKKLKTRMEKEKSNLKEHLIKEFNRQQDQRIRTLTEDQLQALTVERAGGAGGQIVEDSFGGATNLPLPSASPGHNGAAKKNMGKRVSMAPRKTRVEIRE